MVLASYFFDANAGVLRSAPSYASALGVVLFPLAVTALGALGAAVAISARRPQVAGVLALPAAAAAAIALLGWLWQPFALCAAVFNWSEICCVTCLNLAGSCCKSWLSLAMNSPGFETFVEDAGVEALF